VRGEVCWQRIGAQPSPSLVSSRSAPPRLLFSHFAPVVLSESAMPCGWLSLGFGNVEAPRKPTHPSKVELAKLVPDLDR
jgi:hypothetical protein